MVVKELIAKLGFKLDKGSAKRANQGIEQIKKAAVRLAGIVATGAAVKGIKRLAEETAALGDRIDKTSSKLGVNAQALQELRHAAQLTGVQTNTMDLALQRFTRRAAEAAKGSGVAKDVLRQMGVALKDSQGRLRPTEEMLGDVAEAMRRTKGDGERLRMAFALFDSEGAALVNTLKGGKAALEAMRQEARDLGGVMDQELIDLSVEYTDESLRASKAIRGVKNMLAKQLLPWLIKSKTGIVDWIKANREWLRTNITEAVKTFRQVVAGLYQAVRVLVVGLGEAWRNADPVTKSLLKMSGAAAVLAVILASPILTLLAIAAAVGLVMDDFDAWQQGADSVIGAIDKKLGGFLSAVRDGEADILNLGVAWEFWRDKGAGALEWIGEALVTAAKWWGEQFKWLFWDLPVSLIKRLAGWVVGFFEKHTFLGKTVARLAGAAGTLAGGGGLGAAGNVLLGRNQVAQPPIGSPAAGGGAAVSMRPTTNITVNNAQGLNEKQLADEIGARMAEENDRNLRNAALAYSPAPAQ